VIPVGAPAQVLPSTEPQPVRGLSFPALSPDGKTICFSYLGDLWTVSSEGGRAARLTIHEAHDAYPRYSPDGKWIAFASNRYPAAIYNYDIYVMPSGGGAARRITYSTVNDYPNDWSPDGSRILFYSMRGVRNWQLYSVEVKTGVSKQLTDDPMYIRYGAWSPDGTAVTYTRAGSTATWSRPRYKGSANMELYSKNLATGKVTRLTEYDGMDLWPLYSRDGKTIYYVSDRLTPGTSNLVSSPASGGKPTPVTKHANGAVRWPGISRNGESIAYEREGDLYIVATTGGQSRKLRILAPTDEKENETTRLSLTSGATEVEVSPDGKTLALVVRGEIWSIPADKGGDAERLTDNPANDYDIYWSPDSSKLAFVSDRNGQFDIFTLDVKTNDLKPISAHADDENTPKWSPDGRSIAFLRSGKTGGLYVANGDGSGEPRRVAESLGNNMFTQGMYAAGISSFNWSPDGKWLAFARTDTRHIEDLWLVPTAGGAARNITYFPGRNNSPEWSSDGKYLTFLSTRDRTSGYDLYSLDLKREKETEEKPTPKTEEKKPVVVEIEWDEIEDRAKRLTTQGAGSYSITPDGKSVVFTSSTGGPADFWSVPIKGGTVQRMTSAGEGTIAPRYPTDGSKFYALGPNGTVKSFAKSGGAGSTIAFAMSMRLNRRLELAQAFNEFWRRLKVGFYDPNMHGVDWLAVRKRYEPLLAGVGAPEDFGNVLSEAVGELNASHTEVTPANPQPGPSTAELGLSYDQEYAGPGIRVTGFMPKGPNDDLGPKIKPGEYIMQVDGEDVSYNEQFYDLLLDRAGKDVTLQVNAVASKTGARTVKLKAITREEWLNLEYDERVKTARARVDKLSSGRLAYSHIRAMNQDALKKLERELWGRAQEKEGLIIDIRGNIGGRIHDEILAQISRSAYGFTQPRDAPKFTEPNRSWAKPIVVLIDQNSVSDAEIFPNGFRQLKLGKIIGMPTPGYVIGTYPGRLQDGTAYRIPLWGWFDLEGKNLENNGVQPDIRVEHTDADLSQDRDRQLEVAVETLLNGLSNR
jgi:Tol biopolymer transport system component/C-terminal processing protease CtpA/Prc